MIHSEMKFNSKRRSNARSSTSKKRGDSNRSAGSYSSSPISARKKSIGSIKTATELDDDDKFIPSSRLLRITDELSKEPRLQTKRSRKGVGSSQSLDLNHSGHEPESMNTDTTTGLSAAPLGDESDRSTRTSSRKSEESTSKNGPFRKFVICYKTIPNTVPRVHAVVFYIILPLWFLVGLALMGGYLLALVELPHEIQANDEMLADQYRQESLDKSGNKTVNYLLNDLPTQCFESYLKEQNISDTNYTLFDVVMLAPQQKQQDNIARDDNYIYHNDLYDATSDTLNHILQRLAVCSTELGIASEVAERADILRENIEEEYMSKILTFNWIRCWNQTDLGDNFWLGHNSDVYAASLQQAIVYEDGWEENRLELTRQYLEELPNNATIEEIEHSQERAINDATGGEYCQENVAGVAWFWFTVMTTVGYGNQAPSTSQGKWMVSCLGFLTILAFGGILLSAGQVVAVLGDDIAKRKRLKPRPLVSAIFWAAMTSAWIFVIGAYTSRWWEWQNFDHNFWDPVWFAYISVTTIGLGDFFLQPEYIFLPDVVIFTLLFLTGFVLLSTFLDTLAFWIGSWIPDYGERLAKRLSKFRKLRNLEGEVVEDRRAVDALRNLVEELPEGERGLDLIKEENALLRKLLERNAKDLNKLLRENKREGHELEVEDEHMRGVLMKAVSIRM